MRPRVLICVVFALFAGGLTYFTALADSYPRDFGQVWYAARVVLNGGNPYDAIGPGRAFDWPWPFYYPLPAAILALPLAPFTQPVAVGVFMALGGGAFTWALTEHGYWPLLAWTSGCTLFAIHVAQWSPLFAGATIVAPLSFVLAAKPNIGLAIFAARPSWWAILGAVILAGAAFALKPEWGSDWIAALRRPLADPRMAFHSKAPVALPGGALVFVGLLRWRRPEARLLVALACVPQTMTLYETVPLFLVPRGRRESAALTVLSSLLFLYVEWHGPWPDKAATYEAKGRLMLLCLYFPAMIMVLRRSNEGTVPAWLDRKLARWPAWLRGQAAVRF
jgi:hypothetical protein